VTYTYNVLPQSYLHDTDKIIWRSCDHTSC